MGSKPPVGAAVSGCVIAVVGDGRRHTPADQRLLYRRIQQVLRTDRADRLLCGPSETGADWFMARAAHTHGWPVQVVADPLARVVEADFLFVLDEPGSSPLVQEAMDLFVCLRGTFGLQRL